MAPKPFVNSVPLFKRSGGPIYWAGMVGPNKTFGSESGDVADLAGRTAAGTRGSGVTWSNGPWGGALAFSGSGTGVAVNPSAVAVSYPLTVMAWFMWSGGTPNYQAIFCNRHTDGTRKGYGLLLTSDYKVRFDGYPADGTVGHSAIGTTTLSAGTWYCAAGVMTYSAMSVYLNGRLEGTDASGPPLPTSSTAAEIGHELNTSFSSTTWTGRISDVRVWDRALTAAEIAREFADPYWRLRPSPRLPYASPVTFRPGWAVSSSVVGLGVY